MLLTKESKDSFLRKSLIVSLDISLDAFLAAPVTFFFPSWHS